MKKLLLFISLSLSVLLSSEIDNNTEADLKKQFNQFSQGFSEKPIKPSVIDSSTLDIIKYKMKITLNERINIMEEQKICIEESKTEEDLHKCKEEAIFKIRDSINKVRN